MRDGIALAEMGRAATAAAVAAAYPLIGLGPAVKGLLDEVATVAMESSLASSDRASDLAVAACEGARDAASSLRLRPGAAPGIHVLADPLDGTLNAARGGPRSFSVLAFKRARASAWVDRLDDRTAVFAIGSRHRDVTALLRPDDAALERLRAALGERSVPVATLNRADNLALLADLGGPPAASYQVGSRAGYRPTLFAPGVVAVGDATVPLPFETGMEIGRVGLVEARIAASLHTSWTGLLVSRQRIKESEGGTVAYLRNYLTARQRGDDRVLSSLFTPAERAHVSAIGVGLQEATSPLAAADFGAGDDAVVVIAALSSDHDPWIPDRSPLFAPPIWSAETQTLHVDTLAMSAGEVVRRSHPVRPARLSALDPALRQWYRTLDWESALAQARRAADPVFHGLPSIASGLATALPLSGYGKKASR